MAIVRVQSTHASSSTAATSRALAYVSNVTAGNLLIVAIYFESATATISSVVSTLSGALTAIGTLTRSGNNTVAQLFYLKNCTGGADTITVTYSASVINGIAIFECSGADTAAPLRGNASAAGGTTNPSSGNLNVAPVSGDYLFGQCTANAAPTAGSGYTMEESNFGWNDTSQAEDKTAASETAVLFTNASTSTWVVAGAAFIPSGAAPPVAKTLCLLGVGS